MRAYFARAEKGDTRAGADILARMIGPAPQRVEVSGPGGSPVQLQSMAPIALALMSTAQLQALQAFHSRLGLEPAIDAELAPAAEPGQPEPAASAVPGPSDAPALLPLVYPSPVSPCLSGAPPDAAAGTPADTANQVTENQADNLDPDPQAVTERHREHDGGPVRAAHATAPPGAAEPGREGSPAGGESA
jgi:hypothetical protein